MDGRRTTEGGRQAAANGRRGTGDGGRTRGRPTWRSLRRSVPALVGAVLGGVLVLFLLVPLATVVGWALSSGTAPELLAKPVVRDALWLSAVTTLATVALSVVFGTPLAYVLARCEFRGRALLDTLIDLPMVLPPAVAGIALLVTFGRFGLLRRTLELPLPDVAFTTTAVVLAQAFVAAPFFVRAARAGFAGVDRDLELVSRTLGVSDFATFWRVTVPLAAPALLGGVVMAWARALGEFGATIMFAGNFQGRTQTMPLAIYVALESDLDAALLLATILVVVSFAVLIGFKLLVGRRTPLDA